MCSVPPKFYQLCRICLSLPNDDGNTSTFDKELSRKIMTCLSIVVTDSDQLPQIVCMKCSNQLDAFNCFREKAKQTEDHLKKFLQKTKQLTGTSQEKHKKCESLLNMMMYRPCLNHEVKIEEEDVEDVDHRMEREYVKGRLKVEPELQREEPVKIKVKSDADLLARRSGSPMTSIQEPTVLPYNIIQTRFIADNLPPHSISPSSPIEPADLSSRKPENVTCVPELPDFIKDETDAASDYSNSSDPERLEVDMSQGIDDHSNSTTRSAPSPASELPHSSDNTDFWQAFSQNGHTSASLSGEASHLLRKLISCRKLGMTITPAPPYPADTFDHGKEAKGSAGGGRRKQSFPTKMELDDSSPSRHDPEVETDYVGEFNNTGPWQIVKNARGAGMARRMDLACTNCGTQTTTIWRRNMKGEMVCNACGLYYKLHGVDRPHTMRRDTIHTRRRRPKGIAPKKNSNNNSGDITDTEDMLTALRKQLQPHLVRALTGKKNLQQGVTTYSKSVNSQSPTETVEIDSEDENYRDLPLNLVATQMAETETH
ncbi:PREDICTED: uncharacterized protein LOC108557777 isoform X2 [Nicrophorus vespilloides]|uniref:Uncharacterized protein LOC108557777 isoform X2 n=1 Tax=Nicrophorus vespilloides TaxID=110193 RepID=A0ABM1M5S0_NICVS|nr:PREDICTED: uncharacterized protein LOC108557777 isoform X2 [Nicrophorus vespilloides]